MKRRVGWGISPIALLFFAGMIITDQSGICIAAIAAALVHEAGHLLAARWMHIALSGVRVELFGARIAIGSGAVSYGQEWVLCAAGPFASLLLAAAVAPLGRSSEFFLALAYASLLLGGLNLLPIRSFDGGRMTEVLLCRFLGTRAAFLTVNALTAAMLFLLWATAAYFLLRSGGGFSFFCFALGLLARFIEYGKIGQNESF